MLPGRCLFTAKWKKKIQRENREASAVSVEDAAAIERLLGGAKSTAVDHGADGTI